MVLGLFTGSNLDCAGATFEACFCHLASIANAELRRGARGLHSTDWW